VDPGEQFTCSASSGYPGDPSTTLHYWLESGTNGDVVGNGMATYQVNSNEQTIAIFHLN